MDPSLVPSAPALEALYATLAPALDALESGDPVSLAGPVGEVPAPGSADEAARHSIGRLVWLAARAGHWDEAVRLTARDELVYQHHLVAVQAERLLGLALSPDEAGRAAARSRSALNRRYIAWAAPRL